MSSASETTGAGVSAPPLRPPRTAARSRTGPLAHLRHSVAVFLRVLYWAATFQLRSGLQRYRYAKLIRRSHLFVPEFYLAQCHGDASARRDPIEHYLRLGAAAGHDPNPFFDTRHYLERYPDVAAAGKNPLVHYIRYGTHTRAPSALFDPVYYLARYPEVRAAPVPPLAHFLETGHAEGLVGVAPEAPVLVPDLLDWAARTDPSAARRVLVVDHRMLTPDQDSGSVRMLALLRMLRQLGLEVTFGADCPDRGVESGDRLLSELGIEVLYGLDRIRSHLAEAGSTYGTVLLSRPHVGRRFLALARAYAVRAKVVYDTVDLHWVRHDRAAQLLGDDAQRAEAERLRALELLLAHAADLTLAITPDEREVLARAAPDVSLGVLPNVHECARAVPGWEQRRGLMFIGGYEHPPNVDAMEWFVAEILPRVRTRLPGIALRIVGSKAPQRIRRLAQAGVEVVGYVPDPAPIFLSSRVFVSPLRFGAGMKGKIGQSIAFGLPVVTTTIGAEGMSLEDGVHALVADDPASFADAIVRLHTDELLWSRISRAAMSHLRERFSTDALREHVRRLLAPGTSAGAPTSATEGLP